MCIRHFEFARLNLLAFLFGTQLMTSTTVDADQPLVFVSAFAAGDDGAIHAFQFDTRAGTLHLLQRTADIQNPFFLTLSPDARFLYAIDAKEFSGEDDEFVAAFAVEGRGGGLRRLNRQSTRGTASCYLDTDANGQTLVVANYTTGSVAALPIRSNGSLGEATSFIQHSGSSVDPARQQGPHAHCIVTSPDSRFALAADLGLDKLFIYRN